MNLQQQLEYNWERQVYSVLKDSNGKYCIVSTRNHDLGFRFSGFFPTIDIAKDYIGAFGRWENMAPDCTLERCTIVDTIHPSELMGREGFQVGDRVIFKDGEEERIATITGHWNDYGLIDIEWYTDNDIVSLNVSLKDLKPVLPVEEKKETVTKSDQLKGAYHGVVRDEKGEVIAQCRCFSHEKEKQRQSPCTCDSAFYINGSGVHRPDCIANTNQQKVQSPCEHKYFQELIICGDLISAKRVHFPNTPTIFYLCYKCGLVTCKNPNE